MGLSLGKCRELSTSIRRLEVIFKIFFQMEVFEAQYLGCHCA